MSAASQQFCAQCGARNSSSAKHCTQCGHYLAGDVERQGSWAVDPSTKEDDHGVIDLKPTADPASQMTVPLTTTRRFNPAGKLGKKTAALPARADDDFRRAPLVPPAPTTSATPQKKHRGPGGCFLGLAAFVIIGVVGAVFVWAIVKPKVSDRVRDELDHGISTQVASIDIQPVRTSGQITLTEADINNDVDDYAKAYEPVKNVRVKILPTELQVSFDLYGLTSTYRGNVAVENGRIVIVNPSVSGPAGQVLDANDVASILEEQLATFMDRSNVTPRAVKLSSGKLTVTTSPKGS